MLLIDGKEVLNLDGSHSVKSGWMMINLEQGMHHLELQYFEDYDTQKLEVRLMTPDGYNGPLPAERLYVPAK